MVATAAMWDPVNVLESEWTHIIILGPPPSFPPPPTPPAPGIFSATLTCTVEVEAVRSGSHLISTLVPIVSFGVWLSSGFFRNLKFGFPDFTWKE